MACVALHGKSAVVAGAHDPRDLALACAKCTNVRAAVLEETEASTRAPSTFDVYVSKQAPVSLRDAALRVGTKVLDESPVATADVVFVRGAWVRVVSRSARAFAQCALCHKKRAAPAPLRPLARAVHRCRRGRASRCGVACRDV